MKYSRPIAAAAAACCIITMAGCAKDTMTERPSTTKESTVSVSEAVTSEQDTWQLSDNQSVAAFAESYNAAQSDTACQLADGYKIYYSKDKDVYYIISKGPDLSVRLDTDGNVISAAAYNEEDISNQLTVSNAIMTVLWNRDYIPEESKEEMAKIQTEVNRMQSIVAQKQSEIGAAEAAAKTTSPDMTQHIPGAK